MDIMVFVKSVEIVILKSGEKVKIEQLHFRSKFRARNFEWHLTINYNAEELF